MSAVSGLGAGAVTLIAGFALFAAGLFGGGDAKLFAASSVWFGWPGLYRYILLVALLGGLLALVVLCLRRFHQSGQGGQSDQGGSQTWLNNLCSGDHGIPYGVALAVASWLCSALLLPAPDRKAPTATAPLGTINEGDGGTRRNWPVSIQSLMCQ